VKGGGVEEGAGGISVKSEGELLAERGQDEREMMRMYWRRSKGRAFVVVCLVTRVVKVVRAIGTSNCL
jgi:hypothetical protein